MDRNKKSSVVSLTATEYAEGATVHGVSYIFNRSLPSIDRVVWTIFELIFLLLAAYFTLTLYTDWQANNVLTTLKTTAKEVTELEFPAVTICSTGLNMDAVYEALEKDFVEWQSSSGSGRKKRESSARARYMKEKFSIPEDAPYSITDMVIAMASSNVEKSVRSNGVRNNQLVCSGHVDSSTAFSTPSCINHNKTSTETNLTLTSS